ncbi:hypothetical protein [Salinicola sp. CPA57]|uniref:hypothetical protein n=1 Tax=Salinicola sp. CPA57 TaxID=1949080 RepID=UPI0018E59689|nr:hypothetical protein [Salinicola sp. CPA57]
MRLIAKATDQCNVGQRRLLMLHQCLRLPNTLTKDVVTWGFAKSHLEGMGEVTNAQPDESRQIRRAYPVLKMSLDVSGKAPRLPSCQFARVGFIREPFLQQRHGSGKTELRGKTLVVEAIYRLGEQG